MKVYELAKQLGIPTKEVQDLLTEDGQKLVSHMMVLSDEQVEFVIGEQETKINIEKGKKEIAKNELKKTADKDYDLKSMIPCHSVFPGTRHFYGIASGITYTFVGIGDRRYIEFDDLRSGLMEGSHSLFNPDIVIDDEVLISDPIWSSLKEVYENMYTPEELEKISNLPSSSFEEEFSKLPIIAQKTISIMFATQIDNGTFEQYNKAKIVDKILGTRLDLAMI